MTKLQKDLKDEERTTGPEATKSEARLDLLAQRVDLLEISSQEKHRPWYKQPSTILAIMALAVSIATTIYSQSASKQETIRSRKEELRKLTINLIETRQSLLKGGAPLESIEVQSANREQRVLLQEAQRLVGQIPNEISSYEYSVLAEELEAVGEFAAAEDYYKKAVTASASVFDQAQALRFLGVYYFTPGPKQDFGKGRAAFQRATQAIERESDPYSIHTRALTWETWAAVEFQRGFTAQGTVKLEEAGKLYKQLPLDYPFRAHLVDDLDRRVRNAGPGAHTTSTSGFALAAPDDVSRVLQQLSADDLRAIAESDLGDGGTVLITIGNDNSQNHDQRQQYERFVASGLATFMSDMDVKAAGKKDKTHYDYGVQTTALYAKTREFLFTALSEALASAQMPH